MDKCGDELDGGGGLATGAGGIAAAEAQDPACGFSFPLVGLLLETNIALVVCEAAASADCAGRGEPKPSNSCC